jgi:energy-coupling factor transporter ATP-binding protein EcfA2
MARSDLVIKLIDAGLRNDQATIRSVAKCVEAEYRGKNHLYVANKVESLLNPQKLKGLALECCVERFPNKTLGDLFLCPNVVTGLNDFFMEHKHKSVLRGRNVEPRSKVLLIGPPGNGKTTLAGAIAGGLNVPFYAAQYGKMFGSFLGETARYMGKLFEFVELQNCVLFFDEIDTIAKERDDPHETGEIKRAVNSFLLHLDNLPSDVIVIGATNHDALLDSAVWRRFQIIIELPNPTEEELLKFFGDFEKKHGYEFSDTDRMAKLAKGKSFCEAEEIALSFYRKCLIDNFVGGTLA